MFKLALRGVRHNTGRYIATLLAIITGVAFFAATGFVSDGVIDSLEGDVGRQYGAIDVAVIADDGQETAEPLTIAEADAERILAVDGVEAGAGVVAGPVAFLAEDGTTFGDSATGRLWVADEDLNPLGVEEGAAPVAPGEIAVDKGLADRESIAVGDQLTMLAVGGQFPVTVTGITSFQNKDSIDSGGTVSIPEDAAFDVLRAGTVEFDSIYLRGSGDPVALADAVAEVTPSGFVAEDGETFRSDQRKTAGSIGNYLKLALQAFAILALLVGGFVIYNTFSVIVAQRQRELAVLSAIGATPKQIKRSLRWEGLVIGLLGSVLGVVAGLVLAQLLLWVVKLFGVALPGDGGVIVAPANVVNAMLAGTLITVFSVMIPARRAAKIEPIEALREAEAETGAASVKRGVVAAIFVALGLAGMFASSSPFLIGLGAILLVIGVIVAGPFVAIGGSVLFRRVFSGFGLEGRLAVDNSIRNPNRTATTANALLIGVFLVTFVTVAGTSLKDYVVGEIAKVESADFMIQSDGGTIDDQLIADLENVDGVEQVTPYRREAVTIDDVPSLLSTADTGALVEVTNIKAAEGSLDDLSEGTIAITADDQFDLAVGDTVTVTDTAGDSVDLRVVALLESNIDTGNIGNLVDTATFDALVGDTAPTAAFIDVTSGAQTETGEALQDTLATRPDISLVPGNILGQIIGSVFDFMINAVNGLLLMSVLVALIGIVNTLSLSILERRRELGLLRIMGMTDRRVQRMVRLESALIAALGTITGIALGLTIGWGMIASIDRLSDANIGFSFPAPLLLLVLVLGVTLGALASFIPARRSTHLEVLDAVAAT